MKYNNNYCPKIKDIALGNQWNLCHKFSGLETNICAGVCPEYITQVVATTSTRICCRWWGVQHYMVRFFVILSTLLSSTLISVILYIVFQFIYFLVITPGREKNGNILRGVLHTLANCLSRTSMTGTTCQWQVVWPDWGNCHWNDGKVPTTCDSTVIKFYIGKTIS